MRIPTTIATLAVLLAIGAPVCAQAPADKPLDPRDTDPIKLGWMVGAPPPAGKIIRAGDGSSYRFPQWRWSFSHWRELGPASVTSTIVVPIDRAAARFSSARNARTSMR